MRVSGEQRVHRGEDDEMNAMTQSTSLVVTFGERRGDASGGDNMAHDSNDDE